MYTEEDSLVPVYANVHLILILTVPDRAAVQEKVTRTIPGGMKTK